jgi:osmotically-inducible protein OsmY
MKTDAQVKADVTDELAWDPVVNDSNIGVIAKNGIVTLTGHLDTFAEKHAAERAVRRVAGVRGIAMELDVKLSPTHRRSDSEIAQAASAALAWHALLPADRVKVEVDDCWVTLSGEVEWAYQLAIAEQGIRTLVGVRGVTNRITIRPRASGRDVGEQIAAALKRQAEREARHIGIEVEGGVVTLRGTVHSLSEHDAVVGAATAARGVTRIVDRLEVEA